MAIAGEDNARPVAIVQQISLVRATELARTGRYRDAEHLLVAMLNKVHPPVAALDLAARIHAQQGHWEDARALWDQALQADPDNPTYMAALHCVERSIIGPPMQRLFIRLVAWLALLKLRVSSWFLRRKLEPEPAPQAGSEQLELAPAATAESLGLSAPMELEDSLSVAARPASGTAATAGSNEQIMVSTESVAPPSPSGDEHERLTEDVRQTPGSNTSGEQAAPVALQSEAAAQQKNVSRTHRRKRTRRP